METDQQRFIQEKTDQGFYQPLKILNEVDFVSGEILERYFHERLLEPEYLLDLSDEVLTVFQLDAGDEVSRIPWSELQRVKGLIF